MSEFFFRFNVLVVDDDPDITDALKDPIENAGHFVDTAFGRDSALDKIKTNQFDLAIIDVKMPVPGTRTPADKQGIELARDIRELESRGDIKPIGIFIMATHATEDNVKDAINECRANHFLDKPIDNDKLISTIKVYFQEKINGDPVFRAFEELVDKIGPDDFKIELSAVDGIPRILNAQDILSEMLKGTDFGRKFYDSLIQVTAQIIKKSASDKLDSGE